MTIRRPFWKWPRWKSIGFCLWPPSTCIWSLKLKFQNKLDLHPGNLVTYRVQKPKNLIWPSGGHFENDVAEKINRLLPIYISIVPLKFEVDIQSQSKVKSPETKKFQYGRQAAILKVTSLKMNRLLPMATINMHMKFEIEITKQTWLMLRKPCHLQTDGQTDGRTRWIQYTPPPTSLGGGIMTSKPDSVSTLGYHWTDYTGRPLEPQVHWDATGTTLADASAQWCSSGDPMLICIGTHWKTTGATSTLGCHWNHTGRC